MKILKRIIQIGFIAGVVGATVIYFLTYPVVKQINNCYRESSIKLDESIENAAKENWDTEYACKFSLTIIEDLDQCIADINNDSFVSTGTIFKLSNAFSRKSTTPEHIRKVYDQYCNLDRR